MRVPILVSARQENSWRPRQFKPTNRLSTALSCEQPVHHASKARPTSKIRAFCRLHCVGVEGQVVGGLPSTGLPLHSGLRGLVGTIAVANAQDHSEVSALLEAWHSDS